MVLENKLFLFLVYIVLNTLNGGMVFSFPFQLLTTSNDKITRTRTDTHVTEWRVVLMQLPHEHCWVSLLASFDKL